MFWFNDDKTVTNNITNNVTNSVDGKNPIADFLSDLKVMVILLAMFWAIGWMVYFVFIFPIKTIVWYTTDQKAPYSRVFWPHGGFMSQAAYGMLFSFLMVTAMNGGPHVGDFDYKSTVYGGFFVLCIMMALPAMSGIIQDISLKD